MDSVWLEALRQARLAEIKGEVPVGAVVFDDAGIVAAGHNSCISSADPTAHAEVVALRRAARLRGNYRLPECSLAVTLEPCVMCSGAIFQARLRSVLYAVEEPKTGAAGSLLDVYGNTHLNHQTRAVRWVASTPLQQSVQAETARLLPHFFRVRRLHHQKKVQSLKADGTNSRSNGGSCDTCETGD